tara:strand:- start:153 stop:1322 length:1170 start_codon:yes stop_codon:yes gene_type:complete
MKKSSDSYYQNHSTQEIYSKILTDKRHLEKAVSLVSKESIKLLGKLESGELSFNYGGRPVKATFSDIIRVISEWPQNDLNALTIRNIILNAILSSEIKSAGSGLIALSMYANNALDGSVRKRVEIDDVMHLISRSIGKGSVYDIVEAIIKEGSLNCSFNCEVRKEAQDFKVDIQPSMILRGYPHEIFEVKLSKLQSHSILVIDGVVEKVSEIDRLLQSCAAEDRNLLLCARSFSPDVANTLYQNFKNKKLRVIPFKVSLGEDSKDLMIKNNIQFIDVESSQILNTLHIDSLSETYDLLYSPGGMKIVSGKGLDRHAKVEIPGYLMHQMGIIEDRIKHSLSIALEAAKFGIFYVDDKPLCTARAYFVANKTVVGLKSTIKNLGCIISPQT